ncbi:MAG: hypothetical protein LBK02_03355, partial [Treponema sp.]|nr:hypothetical protein [Treponema sp.]
IVLCLGFQLYGDIPPRYVELGLDLDMGAANNYIGLMDVFTPDRKITIDLDLLPVNSGFSLNVNAEAKPFFLNIQTRGKHEVGFGLYVGVEAAVYSNLPGDVMSLLSKGNTGLSSFSGDIAAGASVFADVGLEAHARFGKLKIGLSPALYIPVVYAPKPSIRFMVDTGETIKGEAAIDASVYTPVSLEDLLEDSPGSSGFTLDPWALLEARGFDFSLSAEYEVLPVLDAGGLVKHIPLMPAVLSHRMNAYTAYSFNQGDDSKGILDMLDDDFDFDDMFTAEELEMSYSDDASLRVFRPMTFDFYVRYKPLSSNAVVLKPNIGFSVLTIYEKAGFNFGLECELNWKNFVSLAVRTGYWERLWQHRVAIMLFNLRAFEVNVGVGLQSQDFVSSFKISGANVAVGIRLGF